MPGSIGEHHLQERHGTTARARAFYDHQVLDHLNDEMQAFVRRMDMVFVATADGSGAADCSFRGGPAGFVHVVDARTLLYPEYRGNGVLASLGNIVENDHVGLLFVDFSDRVGLHVNGHARIVEQEVPASIAAVPDAVRAELRTGGRKPERWVGVDVVEAYIHCSKHIPRMDRHPDGHRTWGSDDPVRQAGDYFRAKHSPRPWVDGPVGPPAVPAGAGAPAGAPGRQLAS
jgi:predicted pyridoxine 5'-phosphate oxidase superfamily flavin-nucleotide-binding protein